MSSFSIPLSGLSTSSSALNSIANNLANLNTDGYKSQTVSFGDVFYQAQGTSGNGDPIQVGTGVNIAGTNSNFTSGSISSTGISSNMALQGNGFFVVQGKGSQTNYTRDGGFTTNSLGQLTTASGELVMGYPAVNGVVSTSGALAPISVSASGVLPGTPTSSFTTTTNLQAGAAVGTTFSTPLSVYDSLGDSHTLNIQYTNTGANSWSYAITLPAADTGGTGNPTTLTTGNMTFDSSGKLTSPSGSVTGISVSGLADGAAPLNLTWNLTNAGNPTITQVASTASSTTATTQNGVGVGTLTGYTVLADGTVEGQFSNDQTMALGQVAIASFANNEGLSQTAGGDFQATLASGAAVLGQAGVGGNGSITGGSVEGSNVDLSTQFATMIVAQQGYEANAKVLTTMDQVSQATIALIQ